MEIPEEHEDIGAAEHLDRLVVVPGQGERVLLKCPPDENGRLRAGACAYARHVRGGRRRTDLEC